MNGSGAANKGIYCAYRSFGITASAQRERADVPTSTRLVLNNWGNPEFRVELQKRFPRSTGERTTESVRGKLHKERSTDCGLDGRADPL